MSRDTYGEHVSELEQGLGPFAFASGRISVFADGSDAFRAMEDQWRSDEGRSRLTGRSPLMLERDRILYSDELRRQADKHHLLFHGQQRVRRDYVSHTLRVAQVARSVSRRLALNSDLAEAVALGSKVGAVPFLHVAKGTVDVWVRDRLKEIDDSAAQTRARTTTARQDSLLDVAKDGSLVLPDWLNAIHDKDVRSGVGRFLPWASGSSETPAYSSGQQSYWMLSTHPFLVTGRTPYVPQTLYGIWRHSLGGTSDTNSFRHHLELEGDRPTSLTLSEEHLTHEAVVVRYADDVTWVIENLNEANRAASLGGERNGIFAQLALQLSGEEPPPALMLALQPVPNTGALYTYFIDDLVRTSQALFLQAGPTDISETRPLVAQSADAGRLLRLMKKFLSTHVFATDRIRLRNETLSVISRTILDLLYESHAQSLVEAIKGRARLEGWTDEATERALSLTEEPTHRVQASVDTLALMSDKEVYDFMGLETS